MAQNDLLMLLESLGMNRLDWEIAKARGQLPTGQMLT
jgi:hypothetical protein